MAANNLTDLYEFIIPEVPDCPKSIILQHIRLVLRDFCRRTQCWTVELDPILLVNTVDEYEFDGLIPSFAECDTIRRLELNDVELTPVTDWKFTSKTSIKLTATPTADTNVANGETGLEIEAVLLPIKAATIIDGDLYDSHYETWASLVKAKLMMMPKKLWSNPQLGAYYKEQGYWGMSDARWEQETGNTRKDLIALPEYPI